jgi:methyl-accepting chemotaxis protein
MNPESLGDKRRLMESVREAFEFKTFRMMFTVIFLAFILALALGYTYFFWHQVFMSSQSLPPVLENAGAVGQVLLLVLILIAILIAWITVVISLRILGPLKRLERDLLRMARGDIPEPIKFRNRDEVEFHMISLPFNELVERMKHERSELLWLQERCLEIRAQAEKKNLNPEDVLVQLKAQEERLAELLKT